MLREIEQGGEDCARKLDGWQGDIMVSREQIKAAGASLTPQMRKDIEFSHARVQAFAEAQRASMREFETELSPWLFAGQRLVPVTTAGCYVPGVSGARQR